MKSSLSENVVQAGIFSPGGGVNQDTHDADRINRPTQNCSVEELKLAITHTYDTISQDYTVLRTCCRRREQALGTKCDV
jgi:hypothetical protein